MAQQHDDRKQLRKNKSTQVKSSGPEDLEKREIIQEENSPQPASQPVLGREEPFPTLPNLSLDEPEAETQVSEEQPAQSAPIPEDTQPEVVEAELVEVLEPEDNIPAEPGEKDSSVVVAEVLPEEEPIAGQAVAVETPSAVFAFVQDKQDDKEEGSSAVIAKVHPEQKSEEKTDVESPSAVFGGEFSQDKPAVKGEGSSPVVAEVVPGEDEAARKEANVESPFSGSGSGSRKQDSAVEIVEVLQEEEASAEVVEDVEVIEPSPAATDVEGREEESAVEIVEALPEEEVVAEEEKTTETSSAVLADEARGEGSSAILAEVVPEEEPVAEEKVIETPSAVFAREFMQDKPEAHEEESPVEIVEALPEEEVVAEEEKTTEPPSAVLAGEARVEGSSAVIAEVGSEEELVAEEAEVVEAVEPPSAVLGGEAKKEGSSAIIAEALLEEELEAEEAEVVETVEPPSAVLGGEAKKEGSSAVSAEALPEEELVSEEADQVEVVESPSAILGGEVKEEELSAEIVEEDAGPEDAKVVESPSAVFAGEFFQDKPASRGEGSSVVIAEALSEDEPASAEENVSEEPADIFGPLGSQQEKPVEPPEEEKEDEAAEEKPEPAEEIEEVEEAEEAEEVLGEDEGPHGEPSDVFQPGKGHSHIFADFASGRIDRPEGGSPSGKAGPQGAPSSLDFTRGRSSIFSFDEDDALGLGSQAKEAKSSPPKKSGKEPAIEDLAARLARQMGGEDVRPGESIFDADDEPYEEPSKAGPSETKSQTNEQGLLELVEAEEMEDELASSMPSTDKVKGEQARAEPETEAELEDAEAVSDIAEAEELVEAIPEDEVEVAEVASDIVEAEEAEEVAEAVLEEEVEEAEVASDIIEAEEAEEVAEAVLDEEVEPAKPTSDIVEAKEIDETIAFEELPRMEIGEDTEAIAGFTLEKGTGDSSAVNLEELATGEESPSGIDHLAEQLESGFIPKPKSKSSPKIRKPSAEEADLAHILGEEPTEMESAPPKKAGKKAKKKAREEVLPADEDVEIEFFEEEPKAKKESELIEEGVNQEEEAEDIVAEAEEAEKLPSAGLEDWELFADEKGPKSAAKKSRADEEEPEEILGEAEEAEEEVAEAIEEEDVIVAEAEEGEELAEADAEAEDIAEAEEDAQVDETELTEAALEDEDLVTEADEAEIEEAEAEEAEAEEVAEEPVLEEGEEEPAEVNEWGEYEKPLKRKRAQALSEEEAEDAALDALLSDEEPVVEEETTPKKKGKGKARAQADEEIADFPEEEIPAPVRKKGRKAVALEEGEEGGVAVMTRKPPKPKYGRRWLGGMILGWLLLAGAGAGVWYQQPDLLVEAWNQIPEPLQGTLPKINEEAKAQLAQAKKDLDDAKSQKTDMEKKLQDQIQVVKFTEKKSQDLLDVLIENKLADPKADPKELSLSLATARKTKEDTEKKFNDLAKVLLEGKLIEDKDKIDVAGFEKALKDMTENKAVLAKINQMLEKAELKDPGDKGVEKLLVAWKELDTKLAEVNKSLVDAKIKDEGARGIKELIDARAKLEAQRDNLEATLQGAFKELVDASIVPPNADPAKEMVKGMQGLRIKAENPLTMPLNFLASSISGLGMTTAFYLEQGLENAAVLSELKFYHAREPLIDNPERKVESLVRFFQNRQPQDGKQLTGAIREAEWVLSEQAKSSPEAKAKARFLTGLAYRDQEKFPEARKAFGEALKDGASVKSADPWLGQVKQAMQELTDPNAYYLPRIDKLQESGNWSGALTEVDAALRAIPEDPRLLARRSLIRLELARTAGKMPPEAQKAIRADADLAAQDAKSAAEAAFVLGMLEEETGNFTKAEDMYRQALKIHKGSAEEASRIRLSLGRLLQRERPISVEPKAEPKVEPKVDPKEEPKVDPKKEEPKVEPKVDPKEEPKVDPKKEEPKVEPKVDPKEEPKVEPKVDPKEEPKVDPKKEEPKVDPKVDPKEEPKVDPKKEEPKVDPKVDPKEEPKVDPKKEEPKVEPKVDPKEEPKVDPKEEPKVDPKKEEPKVEPKVEPKEEPKVDPKKEDPKEEPKVEPKKEENKKVDESVVSFQSGATGQRPWAIGYRLIAQASFGAQPGFDEDEDPVAAARLKESIEIAQELMRSENPKIKGQGKMLYGQALAKQGRRTEGLREYLEGLRLYFPGRETDELLKMVEQHPVFLQPDTLTRPNPYLAEQHYAFGQQLYWAKKYPEAEEHFRQAATFFNEDARYYYFLGLAQLAQKTPLKRDAADLSFTKGAKLEAQRKPSLGEINASLERIQGQLRQFINRYRAGGIVASK